MAQYQVGNPNVGNVIAYDFEQITVSNAAGGIGPTAAKYQTTTKKAVMALVTVVAQPITLRYDAAAPTTSAGHLLLAADSILICGAKNIANLLMIKTGATDATVSITYFYAE